MESGISLIGLLQASTQSELGNRAFLAEGSDMAT